MLFDLSEQAREQAEQEAAEAAKVAKSMSVSLLRRTPTVSSNCGAAGVPLVRKRAPTTAVGPTLHSSSRIDARKRKCNTEERVSEPAKKQRRAQEKQSAPVKALKPAAAFEGEEVAGAAVVAAVTGTSSSVWKDPTEAPVVTKPKKKKFVPKRASWLLVSW